MEMDLAGIKNQNEYYTNHYFTSIFKENAEDTISAWKKRAKEDCVLPWNEFRDTSRQYYRIREKYLYSKNEESSKPQIQMMASLYLKALGYGDTHSVNTLVGNDLTVPVFHEVTKSNGAPLLWAFLCVADEKGEDILQSKIFAPSEDEDALGTTVELCNDDIMAKLFFAGDEAPRFIILLGINQIALIDRNKWNEKRFLQFDLEEIFSRHSESTFMALTVLLHKESLCPSDGNCVLDNLDENSHKHSAGVSDALKYALRESIEILGNEVIYDMKTRQGVDLEANPIDASELTLECLRYMYRFLFMLFIEARPELGYAPMKSQTYVQGYSLEGLRDICDRLNEESEVLSEGYYLDDTISELFRMIYEGYPGDLDAYKKAIEIEKESMHDAFTIEALKAHIFDPEYTRLITKARIRNCAMLQIIDLMSISRPANSKQRRGRISYSALGINQMGAVYEALLSYRGFIAEETLFEVKRAGDSFNELEVGYFVPERELENYTEEERVRVNDKDPKSPLRKYEKGSFIYRLAGREREKSASYYTPEVLTKCLVKYALKELLKDKTADEILNLTICEPAMGSAAFLNEAINQIAEAYLNKKQEELGETIAFDKRFEELQKVKMYIADRNVYGVDLNPIAVELAEVSLWLNTIYKGAYVPWFGTQLVCGNSLIGARRQVYPTSKLTKGKWYEEAPIRVTPGEARLRKGQKKVTKGVYHFLLGDPGMANYTDKVIKGLEPDNIKKINDWRKEFTKKYDADDIETLLNLSEVIDELWERTAELRKKLETATSEPLSVYGHVESGEGAHLTIREKDDIYHKMFKSEHMNNAGPYARLKAAMDYWCALWFWPIDKADLLPDRQEFFLEMSLILQGGLQAVNVNSSGQIKFDMDENGEIRFFAEGDQLALEFQSQYSDLATVCLDDLRTRSERLAIVNQIAEEQHFQHWELEFADIFDDRGGFDLMIGNPPWVKVWWNEQAVASEFSPLFAVRNATANTVSKARAELVKNVKYLDAMFLEYTNTTGCQNFLGAAENYYLLKGTDLNLFKYFVPQSSMLSNEKGVFSFVHPTAIFDETKSYRLRMDIIPKLRRCYRFENEEKLFKDVGNTVEFTLCVYSNEITGSFDLIANLYDPATIDECYMPRDGAVLAGTKDINGNWNKIGHPLRMLKVDEDVLRVFSNIFDGENKPLQARIPAIHAQSLINVLLRLANYPYKVKDLKEKAFGTTMWSETGAQEDNIIEYCVQYPHEEINQIVSGPLIGVANPIFQSCMEECLTHRAFYNVDLRHIPEDYLQQCKYSIKGEKADFCEKIPLTPWKTKYSSEYKILSRRRLGQNQERTLISAIYPRGATHVNTVSGVVMQSEEDLLTLAGEMTTIVLDGYIKIMKKGDIYFDTVENFPIIKGKYREAIVIRTLLLNSTSNHYDSLWGNNWKPLFNEEKWGKENLLLDQKAFKKLTGTWVKTKAFITDYARRELQVELDVLVAMAIGMGLEDLINLYVLQFPIMQQYEEDTWYDAEGKIVFTNSRGLTQIGLDRNTWEENKSNPQIVKEIEINYVENPYHIKETYLSPYVKCNRIDDYRLIWECFEKRFS